MIRRKKLTLKIPKSYFSKMNYLTVKVKNSIIIIQSESKYTEEQKKIIEDKELIIRKVTKENDLFKKEERYH